VVDDNQENAKLLVKWLQTIGFEVREAENGEKAIAIWEIWQPHLMWMDTRMPVMNGIEATRQIRARETAAATSQVEGQNPSISHHRTVIIALTSSTSEEKFQEILAAGYDNLVCKPAPAAVIFATMAEYLDVSYFYEKFPLSRNSTIEQCYSINNIPTSDLMQQLSRMPKNWMRQLYNAANEVNEELIHHLITQISTNHLTLAEILTDLVKDFRFDIIVSCTQALLND
jgi:CheY-like chemotaxis protein